MRLRLALFLPIAVLSISCAPRATAPGTRVASIGSESQLPPLRREFRGLWVATVDNTDWPSRPGLAAREQQAELIAIMNRAVQLHLNAIILQVRPECDAFYESSFEPWSPYLTGQMGRSPGYDPLAFAVSAAHARGLELHAWFNPFRVRNSAAKVAASADHIGRKRPDLVRQYGEQLWLDPGEAAVRNHSLAVIRDVVRRYDVDGVHLDDYFYPYPQRGARGRSAQFPDAATYKRYTAGGGRLSREDWRRDNVNGFVRRLYEMVKSERPAVKVGISPFGIWRPGNPPQIKGFDAYRDLFADSQLWLSKGWLDYCAPQLYWEISAAAQSYPVLLNWWAAQNPHGRHIWPGSNASKVGAAGQSWPAAEIVNQVRLTRRQRGATGNILFSANPLMDNRAGLGGLLAREVYGSPALVPASPWLDSSPPSPPRIEARADGSGGLRVSWDSQGIEFPRLWVLRVRHGNSWQIAVLPAARRSCLIAPGPGGKPASVVALSAVDRCGNLSRPALIR